MIISTPTNTYLVWRERRSISLKVVIPLSLMMLLVLFLVFFLLKVGNDWILKSTLGIVVVGMAVEMLIRKPAQNALCLKIPVNQYRKNLNILSTKKTQHTTFNSISFTSSNAHTSRNKTGWVCQISQEITSLYT